MRLETKIEEQCVNNDRRFTSIEKGIDDIHYKLDRALENKADKSQLDTMCARMWGLFVGFLMVLVGVAIDYFTKQ